jgi:hypothetical protein
MTRALTEAHGALSKVSADFVDEPSAVAVA